MQSLKQTPIPLNEAPQSFRAQQDARRRIEISYETTVAIQELPSSHVAWEATPTDVQATATDIDVLAEWLYVMRGSVTTVELPSGQTVWTLHTTTWSDSPNYPPVPVHLSVVLPTDEPVMHEIRAAVAA